MPKMNLLEKGDVEVRRTRRCKNQEKERLLEMKEDQSLEKDVPNKKDTNKSLKKDKPSNKVNKEEVQGKCLETDKLSKEQGKSLEKDKPSKEVKKEDGQGKSLENHQPTNS